MRHRGTEAQHGSGRVSRHVPRVVLRSRDVFVSQVDNNGEVIVNKWEDCQPSCPRDFNFN